MKKVLSLVLALAIAISLITVPAFAVVDDNECVYGLEYKEVPMVRNKDAAGKTIYVAGNPLNNKTFPLSTAPAMTNTFTYKDIVFSNYISHNIVESVDADDKPITVCQVDIGLNGAMRSNVGGVEFMSYVTRFNYISPQISPGTAADSDLNCYKTNTPKLLNVMENGNTSYGYLDYIAVRPFTNGGRNFDGTWNEGLTWVFEKHPEGTKSDGSYSKSYNIRVDKPDETLYIQVFVIDKSGVGVDVPTVKPGVTVTPGSPGGGFLPGTGPEVPSTPEIKGFSDLAANRWSYESVMICVEKGAITGTKTPDANGIGEFDPKGNVTLGQFLAVVTRLVCPDAIVDAEGHWALKNYKAAIEKGIIKSGDFDYSTAALNTPISREDMAYILVGAANTNGESLQLIDGIEAKIPDYTSVTDSRQDAVLRCYSNGLITGYGDGSFGASDTMTREQMAAVVCRLMNYQPRPEVKY